MIIRDEIAFFMCDMRHFDYFNNIFVEMTKEGQPFALIVNDAIDKVNSKYSDTYVQEMKAAAEATGFSWYNLSELYSQGIKFRYVVSTFTLRFRIRVQSLSIIEKIVGFVMKALGRTTIPGTGLVVSKLNEILNELNEDRIEYPEQIIAEKHIFFPKGMDLYKDKFPDEILISMVDSYLCHGPVDRSLITAKVGKVCKIIGYPRYDNFWKLTEADRHDFKNEFGITSQKPIITWVPTYGPYAGDEDYNISVWLPYLTTLFNDYEIIIRPHPKRVSSDSKSFKDKLSKLGFKVDLVAERDMSKLYFSSDFVLCDSGGVVFSALYTYSNVLILTSKQQHKTDKNNQNLVQILKSDLPSVYIEQAQDDPDSIRHTLKNYDFWSNPNYSLTTLRQTYFGNIYDGKGSREVVEFLKYLSTETK